MRRMAMRELSKLMHMVLMIMLTQTLRISDRDLWISDSLSSTPFICHTVTHCSTKFYYCEYSKMA